MSKVKRLLVGMLIVGAITAATATGTFATFNASTTNSGAVTSGVLLLGNTVAPSVTECISSDSTTTNTITQANSKGCDVLFSGTISPKGTQTANLTLKNEGNIAATTSSLTISPLTAPPTCASTTAPYTLGTHTFSGDLTVPLCGALQVVIAQVTTLGGPSLSPGGCIYGDTTQNTPIAGCGYSNSFLASGLAGPYTLPGGTLAPGGVRYYSVSIQFPDTNDNRLQAQNAAFTLVWTINQ